MPEAEEVSPIIGDIYDAALDPQLWRGVFKKICSYLRSPSAGLWYQDSVKKTGNVYYMWGGEPHWLQIYWDKYVKLNPFTATSSFFAVEELYSAIDMMPREELDETRFYREWMHPQGWSDFLCANLEKSATSLALVTVSRDAKYGLVDDEMRRRMRLLVPHIRRAAVIGKVIDLHKVEAAALADTLDGLSAGMFLVDAGGRIVHSNTSGQIMLAEGAVVRGGAKLIAVDGQAQQALQDVFIAAGRGDDAIGSRGIAVPLTTRDGDRYVTHVLPLTAGTRRQSGASYSAVAAVFVQKSAQESPPVLEALAKQFQLTPAEMRVLVAIVEVGGVPDVAPALGISEATVKTHLRRLFEKTGTGRQADLVKLVSGYSSPFSN